jgi:hypothetical protein
MTAAEALAHAEAAGVVVSLYGDRLKIGSRGEAPAAVIEALKAAKPQIIILLTTRARSFLPTRPKSDVLRPRSL